MLPKKGKYKNCEITLENECRFSGWNLFLFEFIFHFHIFMFVYFQHLILLCMADVAGDGGDGGGVGGYVCSHF